MTFCVKALVMTYTTTSPTSNAARKRSKKWKAKDWMPYLFVSPFFILYLTFGFFPLVFSAYVSFFRWEGVGGLSAMTYQGWGNYWWALNLEDLKWPEFFRFAFWEDLYTRDFWRSLYNTLWIGVVSGVPQHLIAIPLAFFIHSRFQRLRNPILALYFLPFITNTVAIAMVFQSLFSRDYGIINAILTTLGNWSIAGIEPLSWLFPQENVEWGRPEKTRWIVSFLIWWRYVGWNTVLYLAAIQTIPKDLYEAGRVDGASTWQQFRYITIPLLRPMMFFAVTLTIIGSLQLFEEPYIYTGASGGIGQVAETSAMYMLKIGMNDGDFGTASAIAWLLFVFIAGLTYLNNKFMKPKD
jgi:multiple sugar transport system permease protein